MSGGRILIGLVVLAAAGLAAFYFWRQEHMTVEPPPADTTSPSADAVAPPTDTAAPPATPVGVSGPPCAAASFKIFFDLEISNMTNAATDIADGVVKSLAGCTVGAIAVTGHNDGVESNTAPTVSRERAATVRDYLVAHGVPAAVITVDDAGFTQPMVQTDPGVKEPMNRFVSVDIK